MTLVLSVTLAASTVSAADAPPLVGASPCAWGSDDCNVCVSDPIGAINRLRDHGDIMGFHMNGAPDVSLFDHWEGVQRLMGAGGRYLAVSRALDSVLQDVSFVIVEMATRNDRGARFRSNRLDPSFTVGVTAPPAGDQIVFRMPHETGYRHAGGMQAIGNILAVPFERDSPPSKVVFYDVTDPLNPSRIQEIEHAVDGGAVSSEAGIVSLAKLSDGRFLMIIGRADSVFLDFYVSLGTDLRTATFEWFDTWSRSEVASDLCASPPCVCPGTLGDPTDCDFGDYQTLNFVTQCDGGALYLVATHNNSAGGTGDDFADLYRVDNAPGNDVRLTKVAKKHLFCGYDGVSHCDADAAGGTYVDPAGQLLLYVTEHDNDGPLASGPCVDDSACSVKLEEFRPVPHGTCSRIRDAWVELYDDHGFGDRGLMIDFVDRELERYTNYDAVEGFEDKTSSVRWCLPPGATYRLWEDKEPCSGSHRDLVGTGQLESIADLDDVGFGDDTSCSEWLGGPFADAGDDLTVECTAPFGTPVEMDGTGSAVLAGTPSTSWTAPGITFSGRTLFQPTGVFPKGTTVVTLTLSDGTDEATDTMTVLVQDTAPPGGPCDLSFDLVDARLNRDKRGRGAITAKGTVRVDARSADRFVPAEGFSVQVLDGLALDRSFVFLNTDCKTSKKGVVSCRDQAGRRAEFKPVDVATTNFKLNLEKFDVQEAFAPPVTVVFTTDPADPATGRQRVGSLAACDVKKNSMRCP